MYLSKLQLHCFNFKDSFFIKFFLIIFITSLPFLSKGQCPNIGDIIVSEFIQNPNAVSDNQGEWFEVYNTSITDVDIEGWSISDLGSNNHTINNGSPLLVPAGGYLVLGINADMATNGGVSIDYEYSSFSLGNSDDEIILTCDPSGSPTEIDRVEYDGGPNFPDPTGASTSLNPNNLNGADNDIGSNWCEATTVYGAGDLGTPGAANDACGGASCTATLTAGTGICDAMTTGVDTYTATFTFTIGSEIEALTVVASAGTPDVTTINADGTITVTGINEGTDVTLTLINTNCSLMQTVTSPTCVPASSCTAGLIAGTGICDAMTAGVDTYTATFIFTIGSETEALTVVASAGTPDVTTINADGTITVTGINEGTDVTLTLTNSNCSLMETVISPTCNPANPSCPNVGDIIITEFLQNPDAVGDTQGEWFEIYNITNADIDIEGWQISDNGSNSHTINNGSALLVPAGGYLVLGINADMATNGGVSIDYEYSSFSLGNSDDEIILTCDPSGVPTEIDRVEYDGGPNFPDPTGASTSLNPNNLNGADNDIGSNWCEATSAFGAGDLGTPGAANDACGGASCTATLTAGTGICDAMTTGVDTYTATFTFTIGSETEALTIVASAGTPDVTTINADGTITVTGINEGTDVTLTLTNTNCSLMQTVISPTCTTNNAPTIGNNADINDPCACNLSASLLANGTFTETVTVNSLTGEVWTVVAIAPLNSGGVMPNLINISDVLVETPAGSGSYEITFEHSDLDGYALTVERASDNAQLMVSNLCAVPSITLNPPLDPTYQTNDPTITLGATITNGGVPGPGTPTFKLDGMTNITQIDFDPTTTNLTIGQVSIGNYALAARYETDGNGSGSGGTIAMPAVPINVCPFEDTISFSVIAPPTGITIIGTCSGITAGNENNYNITIAGLDPAVIYDFDLDGDGVADVTGITGVTSYISTTSIAFVDGTNSITVQVDAGADGSYETVSIVHEVLCTDADDDGDLDFDSGCDEDLAAADRGYIVAMAAPYNGSNVYVYVLTDPSDVVQNVNTSGLFTGLANGGNGAATDYNVVAFNFSNNTDAQNFIASLMIGTSTVTTMTMPTGCSMACGSMAYNIECRVDDVALTKVVNSGSNSLNLNIGEKVTFDITIFNQGSDPIFDITVEDYIPAGFDFFTADNTTNAFSGVAGDVLGGGTVSTLLNGPIASQSMQLIQIVLTVNASATNSNLTNLAEVTSALQSAGGLPIIDEDSDLTNTNPSIANETDNDVNDMPDNPMDEDDFDFAVVTLCSNPVATVNDPVICEGITSAMLTLTATSGMPSTYTIDYDATAEGEGFTDVTVATSLTGATYIIPMTATPGIYNGIITYIDANGCSGTDPFTITIEAAPTASAGSDEAICENTASFDLSMATTTATASGGTIAWTTSGTGTFDDATALTPIYTPSATDIAAGSVTLTITVTTTGTGGCPIASDMMTLTFNAIVVVEAGMPTSICSTGSIDLTALGASISGGTTSGTWSSTTGGTFDGGGVFGVATTYTPSAADKAAGEVTLTLTSDDPAGDCTAESDTVTITISNVECGTFPWSGN